MPLVTTIPNAGDIMVFSGDDSSTVAYATGLSEAGIRDKLDPIFVPKPKALDSAGKKAMGGFLDDFAKFLFQLQFSAKDDTLGSIVYPVTSVFGRTGGVTAQAGDYTTTLVTEGSSLYYTNARARAAISETITGVDYNNTTGVFSLTAGYVIPTTTEESNWNTAYANYLDKALANGKVFIGNGSNIATAQTLSLNTTAGAFALGNTGVLTFPDADASTRGFLNFSTQTLAGVKTFSSMPVFSAGSINRLVYLDSSKALAQVAALTQGSVLFADSTGLPTQNNSNYFWDNSLLQFIIGGNTGISHSGHSSSFYIPVSAPADSLLGLLSIGGGTFGGSGTFSGGSSGTIIAINTSGSANFIDFQNNGAKRALIDNSGSLLVADTQNNGIVWAKYQAGGGYVFHGANTGQDAITVFAGNPSLQYFYLQTSGQMILGAGSPVGYLYVKQAPDASANYGLINAGTAAYNGVTTGFFNGSSSGTFYTANAASTFAGDYFNYQQLSQGSGTDFYKLTAQKMQLILYSGNSSNDTIFQIGNTNANQLKAIYLGSSATIGSGEYNRMVLGSGTTNNPVTGMLVSSGFFGSLQSYASHWIYTTGIGATMSAAGKFIVNATAVIGSEQFRVNGVSYFDDKIGQAIAPTSGIHAGTTLGGKNNISSATTLTLGSGVVYVFTGGTSTTWTLPAIVTDRFYFIKNQGSANITLQGASASQMYDTAVVSSITILPGEAYFVICDGTYWNVN